MGNRAWLYLQSEQDGSDSHFSEIASTKNILPTLWQILLATSQTSSTDSHQRVFGDAGTEGLRAPVAPALLRLQTLADFLLARAPDSSALYCLQLEGALQWLEQLCEPVPCWFNANLDELSWLVEGDAEDFIRAVRQECNERWLALRERMAEDDVQGVLSLLNVSNLRDDSSWAWRFGLCGLDHPFFTDSQVPLDTRFADYAAEMAKDAAHLGEGLYRFEVDGRWGIRASREAGGPVLLAPRFERIWAFEGNVAAVLEGGLVGLVERSGRQVLPCVLEELWEYAHGLAGARLDGKVGFIDQYGGWTISPRFDSVGDFCPADQAPACEGERWGVIDWQGNWVVAPAWDDIEWSDDLHAWRPERDGRCGLIDTQGRLVLQAQYQNLWPFSRAVEPARQWAERSLRIGAMTGENHTGLIDIDGNVQVPLAYSTLDSLQWLPSSMQGPQRYVCVSRCIEEDGWEQWFESVYDSEAGREVLPFVHEVFGLQWGDGYGWLCAIAPEAPSEYCLEGLQSGIANADGSWLHEPVYAWIAQQGSLHKSAEPIAEHWNRAAPVLAQRADDGALVMLHGNGQATPAPVQVATFEA